MNPYRVLGGRYELRGVVGRGGMAVVHKGRDTRLERWVAVKVLREHLARDPLLRSRFRREAQAVARLDHPGIVTVHDVGDGHDGGFQRDAAGVPYIVMEYIAGQSLQARIREGSLSLTESIRVQDGILTALESSHRAGVVHRDIKPANVMVTAGGAIKVVDFGIAHISGQRSDVATQPQAVLGTAHYLSPEQLRGESADERSDVYAAGCLLYELLTGRPPFRGEDPVAVAYQHVYETAQRASAHRPGITTALDEVVLTALAKDRGDRFPSARSFRESLQSAAREVACEASRDAADTSSNVVPIRRPARGSASTTARPA